MNEMHPSFELNTELIAKQGIKASYFHMLGADDLLECFHSSADAYLTDGQYSLFEIPSLARILAQKAGVLTPTLRNDIAEKSNSELCCVLEWTPTSKRLITFQFEDIAKSSDVDLISLFSNRKELENSFLNKLSEKVKL